MQGEPEVSVLRLGHRPGRDERMTTHVGLTARALGADRVLLEADAGASRGTIEDVTDRFGGPFEAELVERTEGLVSDWPGPVVHLTMYGLSVQDVEAEIRGAHGHDAPLLVVVGAEKVPFEVYEAADYNVGVTNQPHSEVAALAVFLDRLFEGRQLDREWADADRQVVPRAEGKLVEEVDGSGEARGESPTDDDGGDAGEGSPTDDDGGDAGEGSPTGDAGGDAGEGSPTGDAGEGPPTGDPDRPDQS